MASENNKLPNPYTLTIRQNGTTIDSYDGSAAKIMNISTVVDQTLLTEQICPGEFWLDMVGRKRQVYQKTFVFTPNSQDVVLQTDVYAFEIVRASILTDEDIIRDARDFGYFYTEDYSTGDWQLRFRYNHPNTAWQIVRIVATIKYI
jgi:hypothetical protein